jgi:hypothetical protein
MKGLRFDCSIENLPGFHADAVRGNTVYEVLRDARDARRLRTSVMDMARIASVKSECRAVLVLDEPRITEPRLREEWEGAASVIRPSLFSRLSMMIRQSERWTGIPIPPEPGEQALLNEILGHEFSRQPARSAASFVVLKVLLHHWLTDGKPLTTEWLTVRTGYSYPTVANVLRSLGGLIERQSDRRIRLRWFPKEEFARLVAVGDRERATVRFADRSGQPRSPQAHLQRLETLNPPGLAIGGVLGAKHFFADLDLVGVPRLDLSQHCPNRYLDLGFVEKLDPALKRVEDPLEPASVAVHVVGHADSLFTPRKGGLHWADPVECLLDLHEARLEAQAAQFLEALQHNRPVAP